MENQTSDVDMTSSQIREQSLATKWVILQRFDKRWAKNKNKIKTPIKATYISRYTHVTRLGVPPTDHYPVSIYENIRNFEYLKFRLFFWWKLRRLTCVIFILFKLPVGVRLVWGGEREAERRGDGGTGGEEREKCTSVTMWLLPKPRRRNAQTEQRALWSVCALGDSSQRCPPPPLGRNTPYTPLTQSKQRAEKHPVQAHGF